MQRKDVEIISGTDPSVVAEVQQQYYDVLKLLIDPQLQGLKTRIHMLYENLTDHLQSQANNIRKCKMNKSDIDSFVDRIVSSNKIIEEQTNHADSIKKDLQKLQYQTQQLKKKQNDVRDTIMRHKMQMNIIDKECAKGLQQIQMRQQNQENELKKKFEEQLKIKQQLQTKHSSLRGQQQVSMAQQNQLKHKMAQTNQRISDLREKITQIQLRDKKQKRNNETKKEQLSTAKRDKDQLKQKKAALQLMIQQLEKQIAETAQGLKNEKKNKDDQQRLKIQLEKQKQRLQKQFQKKQEDIKKKEDQLKARKEQFANLQIEYQGAIANKEQAERNLEFVSHKLMEIQGLNEQLSRKKNEILKLKQFEAEDYQARKAQRDKMKAKLSNLQANKMEKDNVYKAAQNNEHELVLQNLEEENKFKKIANQVASYQFEQQKLAKILEQIKKQQEKYGIQASHAHSKYYQTLQELKIKNTQIQNLQKENQEVQSKCKHQQNLYEAVRSDRNLYSKDLNKAKQQINRLKKKYKRTTYQVDQLREQIKNKGQQLVALDKQYKRIENENERIKGDIDQVQAQIQSTQEVIKNQENHIGHLKKIIQEAKNQKAKQQKDYDMVRNERDILGTQLIKRNQQLSVLYEKLKLLKSNLTKGDIYFRQKQKQLNQYKISLASQRNQFLSIDEKIRCIDDLKSQIAFKQKELLSQKAKIKALEDELQNPMNVHRWRKLEAIDQENYERILKIQTLRRRLIAKTEEVQAKQNLIRQKQKLFLQLKNILARQPGAEIHEQVIKYRQALKEKTGQMKKMKKQLEDAHDQMGRVKFQVQRLKGQMSKMKRQYFQLRQASQKQVINQRNFAEQMMNLREEQPLQQMEINVKK